MPELPRKTKILATLGPASSSTEMIEQLIQAGADGFRFNFSHGDHDFFRSLHQNVRNLSRKIGRPVSILQDLQGPKIRTGKLQGGAAVELKKGAHRGSKDPSCAPHDCVWD